MRIFLLALAAVVLCACAGPRPGEAIKSIGDTRVAAAFIPLGTSGFSLISEGGSATVIAPGIAATNAHNASMVAKEDVIGISRDYDLLFFRTTRRENLARALPYLGQMVTAYGHTPDDVMVSESLRRATGQVTAVAAPVKPRCGACATQSAFVFQGNAGPGFSGGPVLDAQSGALIGIVFGYTDEDKDPRKWMIYAYDMARVDAELAKIRAGK